MLTITSSRSVHPLLGLTLLVLAGCATTPPAANTPSTAPNTTSTSASASTFAHDPPYPPLDEYWARQYDVAKGHERIARTHTEAKNYAEALKNHQAALTIYQRGLQAQPGEERWMDVTALALGAMGRVANLNQDFKLALTHYEAARPHREQLVRLSPKNLRYRHNLNVLHHAIGMTHMRLKNHAASTQAFQLALKSSAQLREAEPHDPRWAALAHTDHYRYAEAAIALHRESEAAQHVTAGEAAIRAALKLAPDNTLYRLSLSDSLVQVGTMKLRQNDAKGAVAPYKEALSIRQAAAESTAATPNSTSLWGAVAFCHERLAETYKALGDPRTALTHEQAALDLYARLAEKTPPPQR